MLKTTAVSSQAQPISPDYPGLVQFLVTPFLESPESLSVDCEHFNQNQRVWVRLAFEGTDKGRVYGRGGRNIQAIRTVLETAATAAGQSLYLEIYESPADRPRQRGDRDSDSQLGRRKHRSPRPNSARISLKSRF